MIFQTLKRFLWARQQRHSAVRQLYLHTAHASRQTGFYTTFQVPDSAQGRLEMLMLHAVIMLERLQKLPPPANDVAQDFIDDLFLQIDHGLREVGIGDLSVGKKIKKIAQDFYGRAEHYAPALRERDAHSLSLALARNIYDDPVLAKTDQVKSLAAHILLSTDALDRCSLDDLMNVSNPYPAP
jgi:cytochrome b pre-mRNA-processing protein 3